MQHKHLELLCPCESVPEAHSPSAVTSRSPVTLQASPKQCKFLLPNVPLSPFQKQVTSANKHGFALHLRNESDQPKTAVCSLRVLLRSPVPCRGHHCHQAGRVPGTVKAGRERSNRPGARESWNQHGEEEEICLVRLLASQDLQGLITRETNPRAARSQGMAARLTKRR